MLQSMVLHHRFLHGEMKGVVHDYSGLPIRFSFLTLGCGWYLDKLMIREYGDDISYEFVVERWLSAQDEDGKTVRTLPVTNIIMGK